MRTATIRCSPCNPGDSLIAERVHDYLRTCLRQGYKDGIGFDSLQWDPKKITQHALAKLTLVKLRCPERRTVVPPVIPTGSNLVGEE